MWENTDQKNIGIWTAAVRHYQSQNKNLNDSTVRRFKNPVEKELKIATKYNTPYLDTFRIV